MPACWPSPSSGPMETGTAWGRRPRAQSHLPNGLFHKVKEKGPEQPYTKYSVASSKGCTEFSALRSTECVSLLRVSSPPSPPALPNRAGGRALTPPPATPSLGRVQRKAWEWAFFVLCPFLSPFEGWARPFFAEFQLSKAPPELPHHLSALESTSSPDCGKVVGSSKGGYSEGNQVVFLPILSVSFPEKKKIIFQCLSVGSSRSLTLTRNQKD